MAQNRTARRALYVARETNFDVDPSADGSGYLWIPANEVGELPPGVEVLETSYRTGRQFPTRPVAGADGGELEFSTPVIGLSSAAGDGTDASTVTDDWFDVLLLHAFGIQRTTAGEGLTSLVTTTLTLDTDALSLQDLIPIYESALPSAAAPRSEWLRTETDGADGTYTVRDSGVAFTGAAVAYGTKNYRFSVTGGDSLSIVYDDDGVIYRLGGCRIDCRVWTAEAGQLAAASWSLRYSSRTEDTTAKTALPGPGAGPAVSDIVGLLSPVTFGATRYDTKSIEIDWGMTSAPVMATSARNARAGDELIQPAVKATIMPLRTDALLDLRRSISNEPLLIQLGAGALSGGVLNTVAVHLDRASVVAGDPTDDEGHARLSVELMGDDRVTHSGTTDAVYAQVSRA